MISIIPAGGSAPPGPVDRRRLDHLVYAAPDLAATVEEFERLSGLQPSPGGRHLGRGTRNFLVGLGGRAYLEIIGPDLEHPAESTTALPFGIDSLSAPRLLTWAIRSADIDSDVLASAAAGADLGAPALMSRQTPSGVLLRWRIASSIPLPFDGVTGFLIDWGPGAHPADDPALPQAELLDFSGRHPDVIAAQQVSSSIGSPLRISKGDAGLTAVLLTPRGVLHLA